MEPPELREQLDVVREEDESALEHQALEDADGESGDAFVHDSRSLCNVLLDEVLRDPATEPLTGHEGPVGHPDNAGPRAVDGNEVYYRQG